MKEYKGFTPNERAKVGKIQLEAIRAGKFPAPTQCELCCISDGQMHLGGASGVGAVHGSGRVVVFASRV